MRLNFIALFERKKPRPRKVEFQVVLENCWAVSWYRCEAATSAPMNPARVLRGCGPFKTMRGDQRRPEQKTWPRSTDLVDTASLLWRSPWGYFVWLGSCLALVSTSLAPHMSAIALIPHFQNQTAQSSQGELIWFMFMICLTPRVYSLFLFYFNSCDLTLRLHALAGTGHSSLWLMSA